MDYAAFERVLKQADAFVPMRLLAYCILSNHWHLVLWPFHDGHLSEYLRMQKKGSGVNGTCLDLTPC